MSEMKTYEGMFLVDAGNSDFAVASEPARTVLERNDAVVVSMKPWDERRLAYEIAGRRRGLYVLTYFRAPPDRISDMERDCQLNEHILRLLVLRRDHLPQDVIDADTPATASAKRVAAREAEAEAKAAAAAAEEAGEKAPPPANGAPPAEPPAEAPPEPPPADEAPADEPPAEAPPADEAPAEAPDDEAPADEPPAEAPPADGPAVEPPVEALPPDEAAAPPEPAPGEQEAAPLEQPADAPADEEQKKEH